MKVKFTALALLLLSISAHAEVASLCQASEVTVWSCKGKAKLYSLCASQDLAETSGYLQYRAGSAGQLAFSYPQELVHPRGHFEFELLPHGAAFSFTNGEYGYFVAEDIKGGADIDVTQKGKSISEITCTDSTDTLTKNETIKLFKQAGLGK